MKRFTLHLVIGLALIGALIFFYFKTNQIVLTQHDRFSQNLRRLQTLDSILNEDVLKSRLHLLENYDRFPELINEMKQTVAELATVPSYVSPADGQVIRQRVQDIALLMDQEERLQEHFKSQNAVLNSSLRYLPITGTELVRLASSDAKGHALRALLNQLMRQVLTYGLHAGDDQVPDILSSLADLDAWKAQYPDDPQYADLGNLAGHVKAIIQRKPKIEALTQKLISVPVGPQVEQLMDFYNGQFLAAMRVADRYRVALYVLSALLALGIGSTMFALDRANSRLEGRVTERTQDLWRKNEQLVDEMAERQRAERQLGESEHRLRLILESEPECVMLVAADGTVLEMNPAGLNMVEADVAQEAIGKRIDDFIAPEHRAAFQALHDAIFQGESRIEEFEIVGLKGARRWIETHACPLRNADGIVSAHLALTRDVTQRKQSDAQLAYERGLLRTLLENCPEQIYFKDRDSRFLKCSNALARRFKVENADELIGRRDFDFFSPEHPGPGSDDDQKIIRTGEPLLGKIERDFSRDDDGIERWVLTTKVPFRDKTGEIIGTFGISKDITAMKNAESKLELVHQQLLETSRQAGMAEVATSVLHNVGNVLNSVNISCSVLATAVRKSGVEHVTKISNLFRDNAEDLVGFFQRNPMGQKIPGFLHQLSERLVTEQGVLLREVGQLSENIGHIKSIVAMQQNYAKISGVRELVNVADLIEESLRLNACSLTKHEVVATRDYAEVPQITVEKHRVQQILVNLICNAKNACLEAEGADKQIWLRLASGPDHVRISVIDNGVGIPAENLDRIFQHGFTTRKDGHGFGLHSAILAARDLGGNLTVQSDGLGLGATFTLELPFKPAAAEEVPAQP